jgi:alpha-beta hydrolase superfamily lysophospholipase
MSRVDAGSAAAQTPEPTTASPLYFGPEDRPLFGWVHQPAGARSRGSIVLCQPLLREYISAHYSFRMLAEALAARGMTAIRFDYDGSGDSAGDGDDPGRIEAALESVRHAIELARRVSAGPLCLAGMRAGALLAARAAETCGPVAALVLWDPCRSGREFMREQSALFRLLYGKTRPENGGTEVPGFVLTAETVDELSALAAPTSLPSVERALILDRADRPAAGMFGVDDGRIERTVAAGQAELMDVEPFFGEIPTATIETIADWLDATLPTERVAADSESPRRTHMTLQSGAGSVVTERLVALGPHGLFGVATTGEGRAGGPAILFLNSGRDPHTGPNRMWVELSRAWAALGFPCYRFDMSGLGDSPVRSGQVPNLVRAPEAFDDVVDVAAVAATEAFGASSAGDVVPVVLAGLCAGAYQALESAIELHPRGVLSINPLLRFQPPEIKSGPLDPRRKLCKPVGNLRSAYRALPSWKVLRLARNAYLALGRLRSRERSPLDWLEDTSAQGTDILCVCGEAEAEGFFEGAPDGRTSLDEEDCRITVIGDLDHGLMLARHRDEVTSLLSEHIASRFLEGPRGDEPSRRAGSSLLSS